MHIAYICADAGIPVMGNKGCSLHVQEMIRAFLKLGTKVSLFAATIGGEPPADLRSITVHTIPTTKCKDRAQLERKRIQANRSLRNAVQAHGPYDLVYERYSLWSFAAIDYARQQGIPSLLEVNAPLIEEQKQYRELIHEAEARRIALRNFSTAERICCVSAPIADYVRSLGANKTKIMVMPNAVNPARFPQQRDYNRRKKTSFTVGFLGTLKPWHGLDILIRAFARLIKNNPDINILMLIIGDGPEREVSRQLALSLGVEKQLVFVGMVAPADVPDWLYKMDVAVAPYPALETFYFSPLKVFEYMAAGLAVIASDIGQISLLIRNGENGILVKPGSEKALADTLEHLCHRTEECRRLGSQARNDVLGKHTWQRVATSLLESSGLLPPAPLKA